MRPGGSHLLGDLQLFAETGQFGLPDRGGELRPDLLLFEGNVLTAGCDELGKRLVVVGFTR